MAAVPQQIIKAGPWGSEGGYPWGDNDGLYSGIRQIRVSYDGVAIGSIQIQYDNNGIPVWSEEHGGYTGNDTRAEIQFDYDNEIPKSISGFHDTYIRRLACESDLRRYGPYGSQHENNFESHPKGDWKIVGFHGRSDAYLRAIGVYLKNLNAGVCSPPVCPFPGTEPEPILVGSSFPGLKLISVGPSGGDGGDSSHAVKLISVGPWGGNGGDTWDDVLYSGIRKIRVGYDRRAIVSIHIEYYNNGSTVWKEHGRSHHDEDEEVFSDEWEFFDELPYRSFHYPEAFHEVELDYPEAFHEVELDYPEAFHEVELDYPREILTSISGNYDTYSLRSLTFESNLKRYGPYGSEEGPYGSEEGTCFSFPISDGKIVSFHGRSDEYLRSIGVHYLSNLHAAVPPLPISVGPSGGDGGDSSHAVKLISVGPWGGDGGDTWDDVLYSGIHKIRVGYDRRAIVSIHIEYDNNGITVWKEHGGSHHNDQVELDYPEEIFEVELDYPQEILTSISGYYDTYLKSLTFESNLKKKYGPYGSEEGTCFSFPISDGKIVSFHGRSDEYLRSIGVYYLSNLHAAVPPLSVERISLGPWGGEGGDMWDDGVYSGIHQIIVVYGDAIDSIHIEYDNNGSPFWLEHGGRRGSDIAKIRLDYPKEILTSISGHYGTYGSSLIVSSLTFESNLKRYGPYGRQRGTYFSFPISDGKQIVGFHGRSGLYLDSIGVHLSNFHTAVPPKSVKPISVGPWGGKGGDMWDDGVYSGIHQIIVFYGKAINSIDIEYDNNGSAFWLEHGGSSGRKIGKMQLDYPKEILTSVSGHYDTYLRSLTFESNLKRYGPYGKQQGTYFSFPISDGKIVGFHGRSAKYLHCIGVHLANLHIAVPPKILKPISVGPWGGRGGDMWDDGVYSGIHRIRVVYGDAINSINVEYENNGSRFWLEHGGSSGSKIGEIQLDYPKEILTSISGHYDTYLRSLTFISNLKKYGPYGSEEGTYFSFPNSDGKIVGFHGRSGLYLDSIGVYLSNFHTAVPPQESPREGEPALIVGESLYGSARQATRAGKKEEKKAERKTEEGSRAREEEGGGSRAREEEEERKEEKEAAVPPQVSQSKE